MVQSWSTKNVRAVAWKLPDHKPLGQPPNAPSIPSQGNVYGYEEDIHGKLVQQPPNQDIYKGEGADCVGPGNYNLPQKTRISGPVTAWKKPTERPKKI